MLRFAAVGFVALAVTGCGAAGNLRGDVDSALPADGTEEDRRTQQVPCSKKVAKKCKKTGQQCSAGACVGPAKCAKALTKKCKKTGQQCVAGACVGPAKCAKALAKKCKKTGQQCVAGACVGPAKPAKCAKKVAKKCKKAGQQCVDGKCVGGATTPAPESASCTEASCPDNINSVSCGTTIQDAWPLDSSTYIFNKDCTVNPWLCSLTSIPWDKQATGLIGWVNNKSPQSCIDNCKALPSCTAVMYDTSGGTCYRMTDLSKYTLQFERYTFHNPPSQRFSVTKVC